MEHSSGLTQILIYLIAMVLAVPIFKKLGLGAVLGYLFAGILLGPTAFSLIDESRESALHISEFGVIMMLFLIGLELSPKLLWKLRVPIFGLGGLQVLLTTAAFFTGGLYFSWAWQTALSVGMILAMSSTAIVIQTLQEKGLLKSTPGQDSFAVLLFQDIAVIPTLALFPILATSLGNNAVEGAANPTQGSAWMILLAVTAVILGGKFLFRPLFRFIARLQLRELFMASGLLLVFAITALMQSVGISPALGAFLAGVVLADSEYRHQIESDIEPFKGILLGVFFISVGAGINFKEIATNPVPVLFGTLAIIFVKFLVLFVIGKVFKKSNPDSLMFGAALAQGGEFAFVLLGTTAQLKIIPNALSQNITASVAISMALAPILISIFLKSVLPRFSQINGPARETDSIDEKENPVLVIGIGRFGQPIVRLLRACGIACTVLDFDSDQVDIIRKFGVKAYFGDGTQIDLLHAAGAKQAKAIVLALDQPEKTTELVHLIQEHFPQAKIFARAYDRIHAYELINSGVKNVAIETAGSAFQLGAEVLQGLGMHPSRAHRSMMAFKKANQASVFSLAEKYKNLDETGFISQAKAAIVGIEKILENDRLQKNDFVDQGWGSEEA